MSQAGFWDWEERPAKLTQNLAYNLGICCLIKPQFSPGAAKPRQVKTGVLLGFYFMATPLVLLS